MSYVLANTSNPLGRRGLGRMGWDNAPYTAYPQPRSMTRLNGEFTSSGPDQGANAHGAITYRIDPRNGRYRFYRTDIKPRGVFLQNTFQHPAPDTVTALGARVLPIGKSVSGSTLQRGATSRGPMIALRPGLTLSGLGCNGCGGRCHKKSRRRFMGDVTADTQIDPNTGGVVDSDGVLLTLPCGPGGQQIPPSQCPKNSSNIPGASDPGLVQQIVSAGQGIVQAVTGPRVVVQQQPSWFNQASNIGGAAIPNSFLALGGALFAALAMQGSKGRR